MRSLTRWPKPSRAAGRRRLEGGFPPSCPPRRSSPRSNTRAPSHPARREQVLFAFDDHALPFQHGLRLKLISSRSPGEEGAGNAVAVPVGPPGSVDGRGVIYYGTVIEVNGELWMWYLGMGDQDEGRHYRI